MSNNNNSNNSYDKVVIKLGLIKQGEEPVFRCFPSEFLVLSNDLNDAVAVNTLKKHAIMMFEGRDVSSVNFDEYVVALMYQDTDNDKVLIFTDYDVLAALKEYASTGKVKILAEVSKNKRKMRSTESNSGSTASTTSSASTQTFVFSAEKTTQVPPAAVAAATTPAREDVCMEVPPPPLDAPELPPSPAPITPQVYFVPPPTSASARTVVIDGSASPDLLSSIADLLQSAAKAAVAGAHSIDASGVLAEVLKNVDLAAAAVEEKAKATNEKAQTKMHEAGDRAQSKLTEAQQVMEENKKKAVRNAERAARQATRIIRQTARHARRTVVRATAPTAPGADAVAQETAGGITPIGGCPTGLVRNNAEFVVATDCTSQRPKAAPTPAPVNNNNNVPVPPPSSPPVADTTITERPFIHGRHTCDGCLTTPIIGKRYHGMNLKDYDLCERCYHNYQGTEIQFEEATLDRDVPFQDRWHMRRARWARAPHRCGVAVHHPRGCRNNSNDNPRGPEQHHVLPPPAPQHPPHFPPCGRAPFPMKAAWAWAKESEDDPALNEAIRRSLEDQQEKGKSSEEVVTMDETRVSNSDVVDVPMFNAVTGVKDSGADAEEMTEPEEMVDNQEIKMVETEENETDEKKQPEEAFRSNNDMSEVTEEPDIEIPPVDAAPATQEERVPDGFSFVSDAEGATAQIIGATLDKMAEAIDGLNWQLDHPEQVETSMHADGDDDFSDDNDDDSDDDTTESNYHERAKIVDGDEDDDSEDSGSHDSWQMVAEEDRMARAAQALGSALFNSDLQQSTENVSTKSDHTSESARTGLSGLDTVPSAIHSLHTEESVTSSAVVAQVQLNRWAAHLEQLHELGFADDARSVEVLETLTAANIGVDEEEEVSVEQVINAMLGRD